MKISRIGPAILSAGLLCQLIPLPVIYAQKLHVLLVADTVDTGIGESCFSDLQMMQSVLYAFVPERRLRYAIDDGRDNPRMLTGRDVTREAVLDAIDASRMGDDDAFLFFWSGHGARDHRGHLFKMPGGQEFLHRADVIRHIQHKGPRLAVVLTDTCDKALPRALRGATASMRTPERTAPLFDELFFRSSGLVDINSSAEGEYSFCYASQGNFRGDVTGGLLTVALSGPGMVEAPLGGLYGRNARGIEIEPHDPVEGEQIDPGCFWQNGLRRLMWQDIVKMATPRVASAFRSLRSDPRWDNRISQRTQTVTAWSLSPILREDDHIIAINGRAIQSERDYARAVSQSPRRMTFTIRRVGERLTLSTLLNNGSPRFGATAENDSAYGVRVIRVRPGSPGANASIVNRREGNVLLESGDVITEINGQPIENEDDFADAIADSKAEMYFALANVRDGRVHYLKTTLNPSRPRFGASATANRGGGVRLQRVWDNTPATDAALAK